ncbi:AraC family transcriptional regulator [Longimicrobium sp.]|uniref:AraC family transcriptional regulator n=1 Tax=Longimicrobium sp. TaxID=2029185 RepID=UPI002E34B5E0|nr:AraC family transcriptional regulator [Longimicrobium sp.]HEX6038057.1 AraC family transcriptional regulator [Longimicrobium sp.]
MGELMQSVHLSPVVFGRMELGAPWRLRVPTRDYLSFYVVSRGTARLELPDPHLPHREPVTLAAGDAVLLPRALPHELRSPGPARASAWEFVHEGCPRVPTGEVHRLGGDGEVTSLVAGHFSTGGARRNVLMDTLPPVVHVPAGGAGVSPQLAGVVSLILGESEAPGPGNSIVLGRLADLLFVHAIRYWITGEGASRCGMRAVSDASIGAALRLMHGQYAEPWTLERLAAAVSMSRSAFAARFTELVGEPPLQYLANWRMTRAEQLLREGASVARVAEQVGYANPVAFSKAFARLRGTGPGTVRRQHRHAPAAATEPTAAG